MDLRDGGALDHLVDSDVSNPARGKQLVGRVEDALPGVWLEFGWSFRSLGHSRQCSALTDRSVFDRKTFLSGLASTTRAASARPEQAQRAGAGPTPVPANSDAPRLRATGKRAVDERRLLKRYHEQGDLAARDELTRRLMPLARQLAFRYQRKNESLEDLVQVANVGLVKAIDRFDTSRGTTLSTYAVPTILGELRRYFRDSGWSVHVSRQLQERTMLVERASVRLGSRLGRSPSVLELATETGLSYEEIVEALQASTAYQSASLDEQLFVDDGSGTALVDTLGFEDAGFELVEDRSAAHSAMRALDDRARGILKMRFVDDMTQSQIAAELGVSQMQSRACYGARSRRFASGRVPKPLSSPLREARVARRA